MFFFLVSNEGSVDLRLQYDLRGETNRQGDRDPKKVAAEIMSKLDAFPDKKLSKAEFIMGYVDKDVSSPSLSPSLIQMQKLR